MHIIKRFINILSSVKTGILLLSILAVGAGIATFLENDYGSSTARVIVYYSWWYETVMALSGINLVTIIIKYRMWRHLPRFIFHLAFLIILLGAGITHFFGKEAILHIREGGMENRAISLEPYLQITILNKDKKYYFKKRYEFAAIGDNSFIENIKFGNEFIKIEYINYKVAKRGRATMGMLHLRVCYKNECKDVKLIGQRGMKGFAKKINFTNGLKVTIEYGSHIILLPFYIKLKDFELLRYPGSMAPSSYSSKIEVIDKDKRFDYHIYMNHTLEYGGYKFFQSSYDKDEKGTILSINQDPGKIPTYIGYLLLTIGLIWNLFDKNSRFGKLIHYIKSATVIFLFLSIYIPNPLVASDNFQDYINYYSKESKDTATEFGKLIVQSPMGTIEPVESLNIDLLYKIYGSISYKGMDENQVLMGMLTRPELWKYAKIIKIKSPKLKKLLDIKENTKYISFSDAFNKDRYKLSKELEKANRMDPSKRGTFEKEIITLDEKLNIIYMVFYGNVYRIFPIPNDTSNRWYNPLEAMQKFSGNSAKRIKKLTESFVDSVADRRWSEAQRAIESIKSYQYRYGASLIPSETIISAKMLYNRLHLFPRLVPVYLLMGIVLLILGFLQVFKDSSKVLNTIQKLSFSIILLLFLAHSAGLGLRWYISGHAPWSDAYESLLYISWSSLLAGLILFRRYMLVLGATLLVAGIFLFTAHLSNINPQITNLVPVLKSYWLTIHVSIITGSYGFLGLGAILGYIILLLFIIRNKNIDKSIYKLTAILEASLIIGLSMLTIGNFVGGVWANESWGRYWGWDSKETWAYISIIVYTIVLHLRLIPKWDKPFILATTSFLAFASILMTYFGVNFYLSGLHSYATGDPIPVPTWIYYIITVAILTIALAYPKRDLKKLRLNK